MLFCPLLQSSLGPLSDVLMFAPMQYASTVGQTQIGRMQGVAFLRRVAGRAMVVVKHRVPLIRVR